MINSELRLRRLKRRRARLRRTLLLGGGALLLVALVVFSAGVSFYLGIHRSVPGALDPAGTRPGQPITVLVLGVDAGVDIQGSANKRTDTMMLVSFDPTSRRVGVLSIPRDTRVPIQGHGQDKINAANVYGGEALAMRTVSSFLDVPINYYVLVDLAGFAHIVDTLGGVVVDVPQRMYKVDPNQDLVIDLQPGIQLLDGDHALQFVRFRDYEDADLGRIKAQQAFLRALADKAFQLKSVLKLPALFADVARYVDANISSGDMMRLAKLAAALQPGDMQTGVVPGQVGWTGEVCYYIADPAGTAQAVNRLVWGVDIDANAKIRVALYNGTDRSGAARTLAEKLQAQGFNVTVVASAPGPSHRATAVYPATGGTADAAAAARDAARAVARGMAALGVPVSLERRGPPADVGGDGSPAQARDVTVVVGADLPQ